MIGKSVVHFLMRLSGISIILSCKVNQTHSLYNFLEIMHQKKKEKKSRFTFKVSSSRALTSSMSFASSSGESREMTDCPNAPDAWGEPCSCLSSSFALSVRLTVYSLSSERLSHCDKNKKETLSYERTYPQKAVLEQSSFHLISM